MLVITEPEVVICVSIDTVRYDHKFNLLNRSIFCLDKDRFEVNWMLDLDVNNARLFLWQVFPYTSVDEKRHWLSNTVINISYTKPFHRLQNSFPL